MQDHRERLIEFVARKICSYEGHNPDLLVQRGVPENGPPGHYVVRVETAFPAWRAYYLIARSAVELVQEEASCKS